MKDTGSCSGHVLQKETSSCHGCGCRRASYMALYAVFVWLGVEMYACFSDNAIQTALYALIEKETMILWLRPLEVYPR